jgi:hypothetical protein
VLSLRPVYQYLFSEFALALGAELAEHGRLARPAASRPPRW